MNVELYYVLYDEGDEEKIKFVEKGARLDALQRAWPTSHIPQEPIERIKFQKMTLVVFRGEVFDSGLIIVRNEADVRGGAKEIIKKPGVESPVGRIL